MKIGVPKEIKIQERRVGLTTSGVTELVAHGHEVFVQTQAGSGIGTDDTDYERAGATILSDARAVFEKADLIVKVKEPQESECKMLREGQILFTYLHLAADALLADLLCKSGCVAIAYETITDHNNRLPLLAPMSEVAGRLSIQAGMRSLEAIIGGSGVLLGGVPGVLPGNVLIIGGGVVGTNAAKIALGCGAGVTITDRSIARLRDLDDMFRGSINTLFSNTQNIEEQLVDADLVIGGVLVYGAKAPKIIKKEHLALMPKGSVLVDVAIDQGGCFETSKVTTHENPIFVQEGIVHYCVGNMPGAVPKTSTYALTNATLPYVVSLADKGYKKALADDTNFLEGLNVYCGKITNKAVAESLGYKYDDTWSL